VSLRLLIAEVAEETKRSRRQISRMVSASSPFVLRVLRVERQIGL